MKKSDGSDSLAVPRDCEAAMLGRKERDQLEFFVCGSLRDLLPEDHVLVRVDRVPGDFRAGGGGLPRAMSCTWMRR